jgi:hypothetical protein
MFGLLGVVIMVYSMALGLSLTQGAALTIANNGFVGAFVVWGIGLVFVLAERFRPRGP